jgi:hypothetical protein
LEFQDEIAPEPHKDVLKRQEKDQEKRRKTKKLAKVEEGVVSL